MKILAVEFSSHQRSVAVVNAGTAAVSGRSSASATPGVATRVQAEVVETGGQAVRALGMVAEALRRAQMEREEIECVVIGLGPGSYTGIRGGIALGQGWHLAANVKLMGISSAECIAACGAAEGATGRVAVVIDAQRGEFYMGLYELGPGTVAELKPLRLASAAAVKEAEAGGSVLIGPEVTRWFPAGRIVLPRAAMLCEMAWRRSSFSLPEELEPIYLRQTTFVKAPPPRDYS